MPTPGTRFVLSLLALALLGTFIDRLSTDEVPLYRDLLFFVLPNKAFLAEHLHAGSLPLWNPWIYGGTPFLAGLQTGVLYPPSLTLALPFPLGFNLFILVHYAIALAGMYLLLRDRDLSPTASAIGCVTFVLGGYLVSMLNLTNNLQAAAWAPWVLFFWARFLRHGRARYFVGTTLAVSLELLGGAPEVLLLTLALVGAWTVGRRPLRLTRILTAGAALGGAVLLAILLTAFQVLPTAEYIEHSTREGALSATEVMTWSLQPVSLLQLLFPHSSHLVADYGAHTLGQFLEDRVPWIQSLYLGLVPLCLAVVGAATGRERRFWVLLLGAALLLALGRYTFVFPALYEALPSLFGKFRYPEKFWFVVHFTASLLAAEGAERLLRGERQAERLFWVTALTFAAVGACLYVVPFVRPRAMLDLAAALRGHILPLDIASSLGADLYYKAFRLLLVLGAALAVLTLRRLSLLRSGVFAFLLLLLVVVDVGAIHHKLNLSISWSGLNSERFVLDVEKLRRNGQRVFHYEKVEDAERGLRRWLFSFTTQEDAVFHAHRMWRLFAVNVGMIYGVGNQSGMDGIAPSSDYYLNQALSVLPDGLGARLLAAYGVGYMIGQEPLDADNLERVRGPRIPEDLFVYRVTEVLPPAYLVTHLETADSVKAAFNHLIRPDFALDTEAVVKEFPAEWRNRPAEPVPGSVRILSKDPDSVELDVRVPGGGEAFLVVNEAFYPGWVATVDGEPTRIFRTNFARRGIVVPAGTHQVRFRYDPPSFRYGLWISGLTAVVVTVFLVARERRRRRDPAE